MDLLIHAGAAIRVLGMCLGLFAAHEAYFAMWFRLDGDGDLAMIEKVDVRVGCLFGLAFLMFFLAGCFKNTRFLLLALLGAAVGGVGIGSLLVVSHREQHHLRSAPIHRVGHP